jgi:actin-related protein
VPFFDGEVLNYAIRRLDVGGKLLTKHLMNLITTRYIRLKNDVRMAQQIKEEMCYVSHEFQEDMRAKLEFFFNEIKFSIYHIKIKGLVLTQNTSSCRNMRLEREVL